MQTPQCLLVIYRNYLWLSRFQVWLTQLCKLCTMKMIASGAPWMFSMSLIIILSLIDLIIFSFMFTTNLYGSNGLFMISRVETNSVNFNNPIACAQTTSPVVSTTLQWRRKETFGFLEKVDHFGDIYIMMHVCLFVTKNDHFLLGVSCNHLNPP